MSDAQRELIAELFASLDGYAFSAKAGPYVCRPWVPGFPTSPEGTGTSTAAPVTPEG